MASIPNPADIRYSGFYLPVFSLLYIRQQVDVSVASVIPFARSVLYGDLFALYFAAALLGALVGHGASRSIYGVEGAKENPKNRWVVMWYRNLFVFKKKPGKPPLTIDELVSKVEFSADRFSELPLLSKVWVISYRVLRFSLFWPAKIFFLFVAVLSTLVLFIAAIEATLTNIGKLLLLAQSIFFFGSVIFRRFPSAVPPDSAPWIYLSEYHKAEHLYEEDQIQFERRPLHFIRSIKQRVEAADRVIEGKRRSKKADERNWLIPLSESDPDYLVEIDDSDADQK